DEARTGRLGTGGVDGPGRALARSALGLGNLVAGGGVFFGGRFVVAAGGHHGGADPLAEGARRAELGDTAEAGAGGPEIVDLLATTAATAQVLLDVEDVRGVELVVDVGGQPAVVTATVLVALGRGAHCFP